MKFVLAFALLLVCVAQIHCRLYVPCNNHFYTENYPSGYEVQKVGYPYHCGRSNFGHGSCGCSKCSPALYTHLHRDTDTYY